VTRIEREVWRVKRAYRRYAASPRKRRAWAADNPGNVAIREELLARVRNLAGPELAGQGEILDVGCGMGWLLRALAADGVDPRRLHGLELLEDRARSARHAVPGAQVVVGDARRLPYVDGRFTLVLMFTLLSSLGSRRAVGPALAEALRVVRPGGLILVYEPRWPNPLNPRTRLVSRRRLRRALGAPTAVTTLTLLPALARRLGAFTPVAYLRLACVPALRTHRLVVHRAATGGPGLYPRR
jgi:SAM-dependent methyltransferase